jgi:glycerate dehydrogenase
MEKDKIVILDGHTLNPGDLSWEPLKKLGYCELYDRTKESQIIERARNADILLTNKAPLTRGTLKSLPFLKMIVVTATGVNIVDLQAAKDLGIPVTNVPAYGASSVAQMVFAHILNITQHVAHHSKSVNQGKWQQAEDWCYWETPLIELANKKLGIIGFGKIGQKVAEIAKAFGMDILINTPKPITKDVKSITQTDLHTLLKNSDIISLHCPLTLATNQLINKDSLAVMKPGAILINTSRGGLINEPDLADALRRQHIVAVGVDVLSCEPPASSNPLLAAPNCFITPHIAWATKEARQRLLNIVVDNVKSFLNGKIKNVVNI